MRYRAGARKCRWDVACCCAVTVPPETTAPAPAALVTARPFAHLNVPLYPLYRQIMTIFRDSKQRFIVHLRPEDVAEAIQAGELEDVAEALGKLEEWGNLRATPDTSRVTTVEDFYRTRYLYQLSREGEAAERALEVYEQEIGRRGELQAVALEDIRLRLRALAELPGGTDPDPAVVHNLLLELSSRLDSLAANATAFMGSLQRRCCSRSTTSGPASCWPSRPGGRRLTSRPVPITMPASWPSSSSGATAGPASGPGSAATGRTRARRACSGSGRARRYPTCSPRSACCRNDGPGAVIAAPISVRWPAGSRKRRPRMTRTGCGGRRSACHQRGISPGSHLVTTGPARSAGWTPSR